MKINLVCSSCEVKEITVDIVFGAVDKDNVTKQLVKEGWAVLESINERKMRIFCPSCSVEGM